MIARTPDERRFYEARLKMQLDEQARLEFALEQGELRGRAVGRIQLLQQLLNIPELASEALRTRSLDALAALERDLQQQLRNRA